MSTQVVNEEMLSILNYVISEGTTDKSGRVRPKYNDGVPAYTKFITQDFRKYSLQGNRFYLPNIMHVPVITGIREVRWIYQLQSNSLADARSISVNWWDSWDVGDGTIGHRYGFIVKKFNLIDNLLSGLRDNPLGRRHIMDLYDQSEFDKPGLHPCAFLSMWSVREVHGELFLDMTLVQRSQDYLVASFINKSQYAALQMMIAHSLGMRVGNFSHLTQNLHIYDRHEETAERLLREGSLTGSIYMQLKKDTPRKSFFDYSEEDFEVVNENNLPLEKLGLEVAI